MLVSFVVPTFEEDDLASTLDTLSVHLASLSHDFEILIADDSPAAYKRAILDYAEARASVRGGNVVVRLIDGRGRGKGDAVRVGALASRGSVVFTMDADLPVPLKHVEEFLTLVCDRGFDVVVGERPMTRNLREPLRYVFSRILFAAQRFVVFGPNYFNDTQCGFKAFRGDLLRDLARRQIVCGGMYDIEYLYAACRRGASIARVPVVPNAELRRSKIRVLSAAMTDPVDIIRVKLHALTGAYD